MRVVVSSSSVWTASPRHPGAPMRTPTAASGTGVGRGSSSRKRSSARPGARWPSAATPFSRSRRTWQISGPAWSGQSGDPFSDWINGVQRVRRVRHLDRGRTASWTPSDHHPPRQPRRRGVGDAGALGRRHHCPWQLRGRPSPDGRRPGRRAAVDLGRTDRARRRQEHLPLRHRDERSSSSRRRRPAPASRSATMSGPADQVSW